MKKLENIPLVFKSLPIKAEGDKDTDTLWAIATALENSPYQSTSEILRAMKLLEKLEVVDGWIELEDADFDFVKATVSRYKPFLERGTIFGTFFKQLEEAK